MHEQEEKKKKKEKKEGKKLFVALFWAFGPLQLCMQVLRVLFFTALLFCSSLFPTISLTWLA